jgi:hypothetical protein
MWKVNFLESTVYTLFKQKYKLEINKTLRNISILRFEKTKRELLLKTDCYYQRGLWLSTCR